MKFAIINDGNYTRPLYNPSILDDKKLWSEKVLDTYKNANKTDSKVVEGALLFTPFIVMESAIIDKKTGVNTFALFNKQKNILIFANRIKIFYWKTVYIRHLFEGM